MIEKEIRKSNKYHSRKLQIEGPLVNWYRYQENHTSNTQKGTFDLRKSNIAKFVEPPQEIITFSNIPKDSLKKEEFTVHFKIKDIKVEKIEKIEKSDKPENNELNFTTIKFRNEYYKSFNGKSIKNIFDEIKQYYNLIMWIVKQTKIDYQKLKFISNPNLTSIYLSKDERSIDLLKSIVDNIEWHIKLKHIHLKGADKTCIVKFFNILKDSEILLEEIKWFILIKLINI